MIVTIKDSKEVWKSPDGQRSIYEVTDAEGNQWQTMSRQIAMAINQSLELTTRVSDKGKTYLIKPPQEQQGTLDGVRGSDALTGLLDRLGKDLDRFEGLLNRLASAPDRPDLPPAELYDDMRDEGRGVIDDL